jgi:hypothetical protein
MHRFEVFVIDQVKKLPNIWSMDFQIPDLLTSTLG